MLLIIKYIYLGLKYFYRILRLKGTDKYFLAKKSNKLSDLRRLGLFLLETFIFFYIITQLVIFDNNKNKNESNKSIYFPMVFYGSLSESGRLMASHGIFYLMDLEYLSLVGCYSTT